MAKAKSKSKHWEQAAKASTKKIEQAEKERDKAKVACLTVVTTGDAKARVKDNLTRALDALAYEEEDDCRLEAEVAHLAVEQMSLLLELEASKDEVSSLHSQVSKEKNSCIPGY